MVRIIEQRIVEGDKVYIYATGLSTDSKPSGNLINGSIYLAVNTAKVYLYNEAAATWVEVGA